jgi:hypothetical protein
VYAVGFSELALVDLENLHPWAAHSVRNAVPMLEQDPSVNSPYRQEFQPFELIGDLRFVSWEFGNVVIDYVYSAQIKVVIVIGLTHIPPKL